MKHTRLWVVATIIALAVFIGFVLSVPHTRDLGRLPASQSVPAVPAVTLHDAFKKGVHTITGSIEAPNACTIVSAQANLIGDASSTQSIQVAISMPIDAGVCLELPTTMTFKVTVAAPAQIPLSATVNSVVATTTSP